MARWKLSDIPARAKLGDLIRLPHDPKPDKPIGASTGRPYKAKRKPQKRGKVAAGHRSGYPGLPALFRALRLPVPTLEFIPLPPREWRLDVAWPALRIGIEIDGGNFSGGAHVRGARIRQTHEKLNALAAAGWLVFHYLPENIRHAPIELAPVLRRALNVAAVPQPPIADERPP